MRIITGTARGRRLESLPGEATRPTAERVKEALFSIIQFEIEGRRVLDLYAGSGQLGIEALSRGAAYCLFVDNNAAAAQIIRRNLTSAKLMDQAEVVCTDARRAVRPGDRFDVVFLDPPYAAGLMEPSLALVAGVMNPGGCVLCENDEEQPPQSPETLSFVRTYRYGKVFLHLFRS